MAFPQDLSNVVVFKIHPAIGIARVSKNSDYFIHGKQPANYKSNGLMKRQAVQFRVFAYGHNNVGLGELTPNVMTALGLSSVWSAKVANRKIAYIENNPLHSMTNVISAEASSNDANQGRLTGSLPGFAEGANIPMGQITDTGVFIPPLAAVFRKTPGLAVPQYPFHTPEIADNSSDGTVSVALSGAAPSIPVLSACIVVAPGDYAPDSFPVSNVLKSLVERLRQDLDIPVGSSGNLHNRTAQNIDLQAILPATGDFEPGFELSFGGRGEVTQIPSVFFNPGVDPHIDVRDMRVQYKDAGAAGAGAVRGQLTSGLCSPWQTDFTACVGYWSEYLPTFAFLDEDTQVQVSIYRKKYSDTIVFGPGEQLTSGDDFERHQDKVGVMRIVSGKEIETERGPGDDIDGTS